MNPGERTRGLVLARGGAVAASQPLAVSVGLAALARGGSFADAAISASAVLTVVEPFNSQLGGDAFLVVYDAGRGQTLAFNGSGAAPASATPESFGAEGIPTRGMRAATVPGLVDTWFALHERFGTLSMSELLAPAIGYAEAGYPAGPRLVRAVRQNVELLGERPGLASGLGLSADLRIGQPVRQPDLAWTLKQIAVNGRDAFYSGPVAERMAAHAARHAHGHFTVADLAAHRTRIEAPLAVAYRDLIVHGQPPPSQGIILMQELLLANGFDLASLSADEREHVLIEAKKLSFADRNAYLADPEVVPVPLENLLSEAYAERRRRQIDGEKAANAPSAGDPGGAGSDTTYFLVADRRGNAVSFIQSIYHAFGSGEVVEGTGILLNNRMTGFSRDPASPNVLAPGKRPAHTLNAWLATRGVDNALVLVGGTPGGHVQVQTNLQLLVNLVDLGMDPQAAVEAPRWQHLT
ncbi:MAG TPA: gamma-glutamyltransferase family protein, partial [Armatimonadaceae bacterium]|nr:gamma-glutamyltransferase family protein [Armatimonadaceae bacterium]